MKNLIANILYKIADNLDVGTISLDEKGRHKISN